MGLKAQMSIDDKVARFSHIESLELFCHTLWWTVLNLGAAWPEDICAAKT